MPRRPCVRRTRRRRPPPAAPAAARGPLQPPPPTSSHATRRPREPLAASPSTLPAWSPSSLARPLVIVRRTQLNPRSVSSTFASLPATSVTPPSPSRSLLSMAECADRTRLPACDAAGQHRRRPLLRARRAAASRQRSRARLRAHRLARAREARVPARCHSLLLATNLSCHARRQLVCFQELYATAWSG